MASGIRCKRDGPAVRVVRRRSARGGLGPRSPRLRCRWGFDRAQREAGEPVGLAGAAAVALAGAEGVGGVFDHGDFPVGVPEFGSGLIERRGR